jgi:predicted RecA/RadA family phage recombinase
MKNQVQVGDSIAVVAPSGGFTDGLCYQIGAALFGVASYTCVAGATGELWLKGVFTLTKLTTQVWALGDIIYWDNINHWCSNVATDGNRVGIATAAAANPSAVGEVRLDGIMNPIVS